MRPYDTDTDAKVCLQKQDNFSAGDWGMLCDGSSVFLVFTHQGIAKSVTIPRANFNKLIDWYMTDQASVPKK